MDIFNQLLELRTESPVANQERWQDLHLAVDANRADLLRKLLDKGASDVNCETSIGDTALHLACYKDNVSVAGLLLRNGADTNAINDEDLTPLTAAIKADARECVDELLDSGATIDVFAAKEAIAKNNLRVLRRMTGKYSFDEIGFFSGVDSFDIDPFEIAASHGNLEALQILLEFAKAHGREHFVNKITYTGPAILKIQPGDNAVGCLKLLLRYGADVNLSENIGPALRYAMQVENPALRRPMQAENPALQHTAQVEFSDEFIDLVLENTDLEKVKKMWRQGSVLITAVKARRIRIVKLLIGNGFDVNVDDGRTDPLAVAVRNLDEEMIDILLDAGAKPNSCQENALLQAAESGNEKLVWRLIRLGFDVNKSGYFDGFCMGSGRTLHWNVVEAFLIAGLRNVAKTLLNNRFLSYRVKTNKELERIPALVWNYMTQEDWITMLRHPRPRLRENVPLCRIRKLQKCEVLCLAPPLLKQICRANVRESLMSTGRYPSIYKVDFKMLGFCEELCNYILYVDECNGKV